MTPGKENGSVLPFKTSTGVATKRPLPTTGSLLWGGMLVIELFIYSSYSILINLSKHRGHIPFSSSAVMLLTEATKLLVSICMYMPEFVRNNFLLPKASLLIFLQFSVPATLYTINNNIAIHMQVQMDPTTYQVLCNLKIATTAVLYRIIMKRHLTGRKWFALGLLVLAGVCDSYAGFNHKKVLNSHQIYITLPGILMMLLYCSISGLAAVYSEYLMKKQLEMSIHVQNMMFYTYGIALNGASWSTQHVRSDRPGDGFLAGFSGYTWLLIVTQVMNGLIMSVLMKHGSNITRLFLIAAAMLTSTVLSVIVLGTQLNLLFIFGAVIVLIAFYLYYY